MVYTIIVIIIAIIAVFLNIVVLLQSGQGQGLSGIAAGGAATQMIGQRRTADFLSKATSYLGGSFLVLCVVANFFIVRGGPAKSAIQTEGGNIPANVARPSQTLPAVPNQTKPAGNGQQQPSKNDIHAIPGNAQSGQPSSNTNPGGNK